MISNSLAQTVESFANLTRSLADADLDRAWTWGDYDSEGVRFAFFRVYEELRTLAVRLVGKRSDEPAVPAAPLRLAYAPAHRANR